jgi:hypothetical protein
VTKALAILALGGLIAWSLSHLPAAMLAPIARAL